MANILLVSMKQNIHFEKKNHDMLIALRDFKGVFP